MLQQQRNISNIINNIKEKSLKTAPQSILRETLANR